MRTDSALACCGLRLLRAPDLRLDPEQRLHVVADLVRQHVRLREVARGTEPLLELAVEPEVDVDLVRRRAVERPGGGSGNPHPSAST